MSPARKRMELGTAGWNKWAKQELKRLRTANRKVEGHCPSCGHPDFRHDSIGCCDGLGIDDCPCIVTRQEVEMYWSKPKPGTKAGRGPLVSPMFPPENLVKKNKLDQQIIKTEETLIKTRAKIKKVKGELAELQTEVEKMRTEKAKLQEEVHSLLLQANFLYENESTYDIREA